MTPISVSVLFLGLMIAIPGTLSSSAVTCDTDFTDLTYSISPVICPGECWRQSDRNQLCGLDKYSGGSICLAAMQLGLVDDFGGFVVVYRNMNVSFKPVGGSRYGVTSHNCPRSKVSYTFDITCDTNGNVKQALNKALCPPGCGGGLVLGSDPYHINSSVCGAAVHAGKVTKENGGEVTFFKLHDVRSNLNGSVRNGVKSVGSSRSSVNIFTFGFFNECKLPTPVCQNNATCYDFKYGFGCSCTPGFEGRICDTDINECSHAGSCDANAVCYNTKGSFICTCNTGYSGDGKNCVDIDECVLADSCHANATCYNTKGSFTCSCNPGYSGDGKNCSDIDECGLAGSCHANATCNNTKGSFICTCNAGYSGDGNNCVPFYCDFAPTVSKGGSVTPTLPASPGYNGNTVVTSSCANGFESTSGSKTSECSAANTWTPASFNCTDINECGLAGSCHANAACYNTQGSFTCNCNTGYSGNGEVCTACYAGVKDRSVKDSQMTASTFHTDSPPSQGRLDGSNYWTTNHNQVGDWLQVDFLKNKKIYGVVTQGRGLPKYCVTKYKIQYSTDGTNFQYIKEGSTQKIFNGNVDGINHKINRFPTPITAQYFRLVVVAIYTAWPYVRLEYLTC